MWPFKRKNSTDKSVSPGLQCPHCQSTDTKVITHHGTDEASYVKIWRGQRYVTCRCLSCGQDFYTEDAGDIIETELNNDDSIDDPQALQAAENELKRQVDDEDDRMFK
jgi:transcriptional regulator NrdR family protein